MKQESPDQPGLATWARRVAVVLVAPPLLTVSCFFLGLVVDDIETEHYEIRAHAAILLCGVSGPLGMTVAAQLAVPHLLRFRGFFMLVLLVEIPLVYFLWSRLMQHYVTSWR
jgi:hypothetical protein